MSREGFLEKIINRVSASLKGPSLKISCKRALGWRQVIKTQDRVETKGTTSKTQKCAPDFSPTKCLFLFSFFYMWLFLSLGLFHGNRRDPKRASYPNSLPPGKST